MSIRGKEYLFLPAVLCTGRLYKQAIEHWDSKSIGVLQDLCKANPEKAHIIYKWVFCDWL